MAHKKGAGSTKNGKDSNAQRRGVKRFGGQFVLNGHIIVRQVGNKFHAGHNVGTGRDFTLYATTNGFVKFESRLGRKYIHVTPYEVVAEEAEQEIAAATENN